MLKVNGAVILEESSRSSDTVELPLDAAIRLLGVSPGGLKAYVHTEAHLQMFTAARLLTAKEVESTQMCINWLLSKQTVYSENRILFGHKKGMKF